MPINLQDASYSFWHAHKPIGLKKFTMLHGPAPELPKKEAILEDWITLDTGILGDIKAEDAVMNPWDIFDSARKPIRKQRIKDEEHYFSVICDHSDALLDFQNVHLADAITRNDLNCFLGSLHGHPRALDRQLLWQLPGGKCA